MFSQIFAVWPLPIEAENLCKITAFFETMQIYAEYFNIFLALGGFFRSVDRPFPKASAKVDIFSLFAKYFALKF